MISVHIEHDENNLTIIRSLANMTDNKRRIFIREHVYKHDGHFDQIEFEFIDDFEAESSVERNYSLWLTREHYTQTILQRYGFGVDRMPTFEEYVDALRPLIAGHCCPEEELRRAFHLFDHNRNGIIELHELYRLITIIGRSATEEKISSFIERVNLSNDTSLTYEQFKQFVRLGHGRDLLVNVSMED